MVKHYGEHTVGDGVVIVVVDQPAAFFGCVVVDKRVNQRHVAVVAQPAAVGGGKGKKAHRSTKQFYFHIYVYI